MEYEVWIYSGGRWVWAVIGIPSAVEALEAASECLREPQQGVLICTQDTRPAALP